MLINARESTSNPSDDKGKIEDVTSDQIAESTIIPEWQ